MLPRSDPDRLKLLFTETDSLTYHIMTEDFYKDISPDVHTYFDMSEYPKEGHPSGIPVGVNMKVLGKFKDEFHGKPVVAFRGLRAKCYAIRTEDHCDKRAKGVKKSVVASKMTFEHYDKYLRHNKVYNTQFVNLRSRGHEITTDLVKRKHCRRLTIKGSS